MLVSYESSDSEEYQDDDRQQIFKNGYDKSWKDQDYLKETSDKQKDFVNFISKNQKSKKVKILIPALKSHYDKSLPTISQTVQNSQTTKVHNLLSILPKPIHSQLKKCKNSDEALPLDTKTITKPLCAERHNVTNKGKETFAKNNQALEHVPKETKSMNPKKSSKLVSSQSNSSQNDEPSSFNLSKYKVCFDNLDKKKVIEVKVDEIIGDSSKNILKTMTEETKETYNNDQRQCSSHEKRKHQITFLAFQAKEREFELKNQWAQSRDNRKVSGLRYGFF